MYQNYCYRYGNPFIEKLGKTIEKTRTLVYNLNWFCNLPFSGGFSPCFAVN